MSKVNVEWEAEDGYAGGARPQQFKLDLDEMAENCETESEADAYLDQEVADDFAIKVTPCVKNRDEIIQAWRDKLAEKALAKERGE